MVPLHPWRVSESWYGGRLCHRRVRSFRRMSMLHTCRLGSRGDPHSWSFHVVCGQRNGSILMAPRSIDTPCYAYSGQFMGLGDPVSIGWNMLTKSFVIIGGSLSMTWRIACMSSVHRTVLWYSAAMWMIFSLLDQKPNYAKPWRNYDTIEGHGGGVWIVNASLALQYIVPDKIFFPCAL